jgi:hypothetical protein
VLLGTSAGYLVGSSGPARPLTRNRFTCGWPGAEGVTSRLPATVRPTP